MIDNISASLHTLFVETGSSIFVNILCKHLGEPWQLLRGAGKEADKEIRTVYPGRSPMMLMQRYAVGPPIDLKEIKARVKKHEPKLDVNENDRKRKSVRKALIELIANGTPQYSKRTTIASSLLQRNEVQLSGFSRNPSSQRLGKNHWSNVETYGLEECEDFLSAYNGLQLKVHLIDDARDMEPSAREASLELDSWGDSFLHRLGDLNPITDQDMTERPLYEERDVSLNDIFPVRSV
jgi:hypothetical protein